MCEYLLNVQSPSRELFDFAQIWYRFSSGDTRSIITDVKIKGQSHSMKTSSARQILLSFKK